MTQPARICVWYDDGAEAAARFYEATIPATRVESVSRAPADNPSGKAGDVITVELTLAGIPAVLLNGGSTFPQTEAFSIMVVTEDQAETDRLWNAIVGHGGAESMCGWCKDRWGVSWQITPRALLDGMADPDRAAAKRVMEAMMTMQKIDVARIEAARRGDA